jgi:ribonuclease HI
VTRPAVVHLDESCLGNGRPGENAGGAGGLIEVRSRGQIHRRDFYLHAPATTNNRMALVGASTVLRLLGTKEKRLQVLMVSDSEYLVKGMREWVPGWASRGWTRKSGPIEILALWQDLAAATRLHYVQWTWVRGHYGHPKNEYANDLAVSAAREQRTSAGVVDSDFGNWLAKKQTRGLFVGYDPDLAFDLLEHRLEEGESFPLADHTSNTPT